MENINDVRKENGDYLKTAMSDLVYPSRESDMIAIFEKPVVTNIQTIFYKIDTEQQ